MSAETAPAPAPVFSVRAILALVIVGVVAFSALAVLAAYAPDLRTGSPGEHALSKSAVGFAGAVVLERHLGRTVVTSRAHEPVAGDLLVLTPTAWTDADDLARLAAPKGAAGAAAKSRRRVLIVLPKWTYGPDPIRKGFVRKGSTLPPGAEFEKMFKPLGAKPTTAQRKGVSRPVLYGSADGALEGSVLPLGPIDRLQTLSAPGWRPVLQDETGATVLARAPYPAQVWVLADPDLLNNQGLKSLDTARAGMAVLDAASVGGSMVFDVTLNGLEQGPSLGRLMLEPPWLSATLCGVAAALLMGLHALARFGQPRRSGRAIALGASALVDNSAGLVRMARKEHELAPAYAAQVQASLAKGAAAHDEDWLEELARRRGLESPATLTAEAEGAKTRDDLLQVARKLYQWKSEMTRGRD
jgi:hypothetical protein